MTNGRFATSLHILTLLAMQTEERLSSEYIAGSINLNPVIVRKELINLRSHGLVESKEGKNGGSRLAKPASSILLADIYHVVQPNRLLGRSNNPNPDCLVGRQINTHIDQLYQVAEKALVDKLEQTTLAEFCAQFK